jgi:hypothetical protein
MIKNDPVELTLDLIKIGLVAVIGFVLTKVLTKAWLGGSGELDKVSSIQKCTTIIKAPSVTTETWILVFLVILCVALSSWICGYLCKRRKERRNSKQK